MKNKLDKLMKEHDRLIVNHEKRARQVLKTWGFTDKWITASFKKQRKNRERMK
jgi:hypothetical protein|tara:strand:- start:1934 stop:2092 length:159 start_codon:yes stop_codon:yes gene_type:complete